MNVDDVYSRALDWLWAIVAGATVVLGRAFVRIWRHEERIKSLEQSREERIRTMAHMSQTIEANHRETTNRLDALGEDIRRDLRIIMTRCLAVPHDKP